MGASAVGLDSQSAGSNVMIVSGISSETELCLTSSSGGVGLESCAAAVAVGDGHELFSYDAGRIVTKSGRCLGVEQDGADLGLVSCDAASTFELKGNGQLASGNVCISQAGPAADVSDVALHGAASSNSHASALHGPAMSVDGHATYWASSFDPVLPVELSVELGSATPLQEASIDWEYPAKAFSISASTDGNQWNEVYSTDVNNLHRTRIPLGGILASRVKVSGATCSVRSDQWPQLIWSAGARCYGESPTCCDRPLLHCGGECRCS